MNVLFLCPRSRLRIWSCETGSAVPCCVILLILHTQAECSAYMFSYSHVARISDESESCPAKQESFGIVKQGYGQLSGTQDEEQS